MRVIEGLVSVIIPFYNCERFLSEAIDSVIQQTYNRWELLLIDDGSTDGSTAIAQQYARRFADQIHYLEHEHHENRGVTSSRNLGVAKSHGSFLAFLDSDDVWQADKLQVQVALLLTNPGVGLVFSRSEYWYDWDADNVLGQRNHIPELAPGGISYQPPSLFTQTYPFGPFGSPCPSSLVVRRSAFDEVCGFVEEFNPATFQVFEDIAFLSKIYLNVPAIATEECLCRYRCRADSAWHKIQSGHLEEAERRFYFQWLRAYLRQKAIYDARIWRMVRSQSWMYAWPIPLRAAPWIRRLAKRFSR